MSIALLSIPALIMQPVALPVTGSYSEPTFASVAITATSEPHQAKPEVRHATRSYVPVEEVPVVGRFAPISTELAEIARANRTGRMGGLTWLLETERRRPPASNRVIGDKNAQHRALAIGAELGLNLAGDLLMTQVEAELDKRPNTIVAGNRTFASMRKFGVGIGWSHRGQWRLDVGWRSTAGQANSQMARLADLASGASRANRQVQTQLTLAPITLGPHVSATLGLQASVGRLTGYDPTLTVDGKSRETNAAFVARLAF